MNFLKRLKWLTASLAVAGLVTTAAVWGDASRESKKPLPVAAANKLFSDDVVSRFLQKPVVSYQTATGDVFFALQIKPELVAAPARPRDIAILVDASASQAGAPFAAARQMAKEIVGQSGESDRISIWMVSTPKSTKNLVRGGGMKNPADAKSAFPQLDNEYASGAIDLKDTLERVSKEFDGKATRQQVILYLGDGESALNPLDEKSRLGIADDLRTKNIAFYAVPLGMPNNAHNLHTIVTGTGGALLRSADEKTQDPMVAIRGLASRFQKSMDVPVLMPTKGTSIAGAAEVYPAKLPPLRADAPTLVVGRFEKGKAPAKIELSVEGTIAGKLTTSAISHAVPAPTADNFFLNSMVSQWRTSGKAEAPAMLRADRTLALAFETTRLAREEFIEQGDWALGVNRIDTAKLLYANALKLDPQEGRAAAGLDIIKKVESGEITVDQLKQATFNGKGGPRVDTALLVQADGKDPKSAPAPTEAPAVKSDPNALLKQEEARQKIREQQTAVAVEESLKRARDLLANGDPKTAKDILVAQRDSLRVTGDISDASRTRLLGSIGNLLDQVSSQGEALLRQKAEENERIARAQQKLISQDQAIAREEKIRERIKTFATLMNQARYEDAYQEALVMENEFTEQGRVVPKETQAVARMGQAASNYRDFRELVRLREERFLLSMMEVEKAHMPYPDEPAVHFPPAKIWREMSVRRARYVGTDFGRDQTPKQRDKYYFLQRSLLETLDLSELKGGEFSFGSLLDDFQKILSKRLKRDVTVYINYDTFPKERAAALKDAKVNLNAIMDAGGNVLRDVSFKTILDVICRQELVQASYWVTPDYIEIVGQDVFNKTRTLKVFPTEDLIVPIPNAVNSLALQQSLQVLGQVFSLGGGSAFGLAGQQGFGGFQGNQQFGGAGFGGGGGQQPGGGGGQMGLAGQVFQGGQGALGFNGQQGFAGQGLGSQFGFQGGPATQGTNGNLMELLGLIQYVVDQGYWEPDFTKLGLSAIGVKDENIPMDQQQAEASLRNRLFVNIATRSIIVHGRSRLHPQGGSNRALKTEVAGAAPRNPDGREIVRVDPKAGPKQNSTINENWNKDKTAVATKPKKTIDADTAWREAIEKGIFKPAEIIACADYLAENREFKHAAELLKASLRKGITAERWYQEALALALEASQGSPEEIERARMSAIDTDPKNAQAYLSTSKALAEMGNPDAAIRLCQIAAKMEPNVPDVYTNALVYASDPKATATYDVTAFTAGSLLARDWPSDTGHMHKLAVDQLGMLVKKLRDQNKMGDAEKAVELLKLNGRRDLMIEMMYTGAADLDMRVVEPIGTTCSATVPQTTAGGVLRELPYDKKEQVASEIYTAAEAFSGQYKVVIDHIAGRTLGNKVTVKVTRNAGTPEQRVELHTIEINAGKPTEVVVNLEAGRRVDVAPLPSLVDMVKYTARPEDSQHAMNKIRALVNGTRNVGLTGGTGSSARSAADSMTKGDKTLMDVKWESRLGSERSVGMDIRSQTTVRPDGTAVVQAAPAFDSVKKDAQIKIDVIPGSDK